MGLDKNGTKFLLYAKLLGVDFAKTATLGRQGLHLSPDDLKENIKIFQYQIEDEMLNNFFINNNGYAEEFIQYLGANYVHSFDYSKYEGSTYVHDMNIAISNEFKNKYTVLLDGGALEHVFNFPVAIKNCMEMVEIGGHYLGITPANNFMGHGFYQFSPEVFFRVFAEENGYKLIKIMLFEDCPHTQWLSVKDRKMIVTIVNRLPAYLLIVAKKIKNVTIFENLPQQSAYTSKMWND